MMISLLNKLERKGIRLFKKSERIALAFSLGITVAVLSLLWLTGSRPYKPAPTPKVFSFLPVTHLAQAQVSEQQSYCISQGSSTEYEWISSIQVGDVIVRSGNDQGYAMHEEFFGGFEAGKSYPVHLTPTQSKQGGQLAWCIWIDLNHDGDFEDKGEEVYSDNGYRASEGNIQIPTWATLGNTRMRVAMRAQRYPSACGDFPYGEVEDITISIGDSRFFSSVNN